MTLNGPARTITGTPTTSGSFSITLRESLEGATNDPRETVLSLFVAATNFYATDTTPTLRTSSWHADPMFRSADHILAGYSKSTGRFAIGEFDPNTGAVVDARIILNDPGGTSDFVGRTYLHLRLWGPAGATLSTQDQERLQGWVAHEYGFTGLLPADHPFKTTRPRIVA